MITWQGNSAMFVKGDRIWKVGYKTAEGVFITGDAKLFGVTVDDLAKPADTSAAVVQSAEPRKRGPKVKPKQEEISDELDGLDI